MGKKKDSKESQRSTKIALEKLREYIKTSNESLRLNQCLETRSDKIDQSTYNFELNDDIEAIAVDISSEMRRRGLIRGISTYLGYIASVYVACRKRGIPITLNDIAHVTDTPKKAIARQIRRLLFNTGINLPLPNYEALIRRYAQELGISKITTELAIKLLELAQEKQIIIGKDPAVIATSLIYTASLINNEGVTQKALSKQAIITEVSLRNYNKKFLSKVDRNSIIQLQENILQKQLAQVVTESEGTSFEHEVMKNNSKSIIQEKMINLPSYHQEKPLNELLRDLIHPRKNQIESKSPRKSLGRKEKIISLDKFF